MRTRVVSWHHSELCSTSYGGFIAAVGYEQRARFIAEQLCPRADRYEACAFDSRKVLSFEDNLKFFASAGYHIEEHGDETFDSWSREALRRCSVEADGDVRVCVDVSSLSRFRIASILVAAMELVGFASVCIDFVYSGAAYTPPPEDMGPIVSAAPVHPRFAGWTEWPELPTTAVFGLGYELDRAAGALEYLEASEVWGFQTSDGDRRFRPRVDNANAAFWTALPRMHREFYKVAEPFECFVRLELIVAGALRYSRPVLIPFGPKLFTVNCLSVACVHYPEVAVWRVSSGNFPEAIDQKANGSVYGIRLIIHGDEAETG